MKYTLISIGTFCAGVFITLLAIAIVEGGKANALIVLPFGISAFLCFLVSLILQISEIKRYRPLRKTNR